MNYPKAGKAAPGLIRHGLPKVFATGEQHGTFKAHRPKTQIVVWTPATHGLPGRGLSDTRPGAKSSAPHLKSPWRGEEGDGYRHVIAVLNPGWRVIACKNHIQWILQRRSEQGRWRSRFFFRTRAGLVAFAREYAGLIDRVALAILLRLPERIGGES